MTLRNHILRDLRSGPSMIGSLAARLREHSPAAIESELREMNEESLLEIVVALDRFTIYRLSEKGYQLPTK